MESYQPTITVDGKRIEEDEIKDIPLSPRSLKKNTFDDHIKSFSGIEVLDKIFNDQNNTDLFGSIKNANRNYKKKEDEFNIFKEIDEYDERLREEVDKRVSEENDKQINEEEVNKSKSNEPQKSDCKDVSHESLSELIKSFSEDELYNILSNVSFEKRINSEILVSIRNDKNIQRGRTTDYDPTIKYIYVYVKKVKLSNEQEVANKNKILKSLEIYSKKNKSLPLPKYDKDTEYDKLLLILYGARLEIQHRRKIGKYKVILSLVFMGIELFMLYNMKIDLGNFAETQLKNMDQYELIFNEFDDKGIEGTIEEMSPGIKLMWNIGTNIIIFIITFAISKFTGRTIDGDMQSKISGFFNGKSIQDMDINSGEEDDMIGSLYNLAKTGISMFMKK